MMLGHQFVSFSCGVSSSFLSLSTEYLVYSCGPWSSDQSLLLLLKATGSQTAGHLKLLNPLRDCQRLCLLSVGF